MEFIEKPHAIHQGSTIAGKRREARTIPGGVSQFPVVGVVTAINSTLGTVDVQCRDGRIFTYVPVAPPYWTGFQGQASPKVPTGGRDLPPKNSQVVVIFIDGSFQKPMVLCSMPNYAEDWQKATLGVSGKEQEKVTYYEQNWKKTFKADTGDWKLESDPADAHPMSIELSKSNSKITVAYGSGTLVMNSDGTIEFNGNSKQFVTFAALDSALQSLVTKINSDLSTIKAGAAAAIAASGFWTSDLITIGGASVDISAAKTTSLKTGG